MKCGPQDGGDAQTGCLWLPRTAGAWAEGVRSGARLGEIRRTWHLYQRKESTFDYLRLVDGVSWKPEEVYLIIGRGSEENGEIRGKYGMTRCPKAQGSW